MSLFANVRRTACLALCLAMAGPASAAVTPTDADAQAAREVAESLRYGHYEDVTLDDQWATQAFTQYLKTLDPQKAYLLDSDITEFSDSATPSMTPCSTVISSASMPCMPATSSASPHASNGW